MSLTHDEFEWLYEALKNVDFLSVLSIGELQDLSRKMMRRTFQKKEPVFEQGDPGDYFYLIYTGSVSIWSAKGEDKQKRIIELGPGQYFGEIALLWGFARDSSVIADKESELFLLAKKDFDELLKKNIKLEYKIQEIINNRMKQRSQKLDTSKNTGFFSKLFKKEE